MKHKKEWHTCDRCEKIFDITPSDCSLFPIKRRKCYKPKKLREITADLKGYIDKTEIISTDCVAAEIVELYDREEKTIELCPDCREAFERFMKNSD